MNCTTVGFAVWIAYMASIIGIAVAFLVLPAVMALMAVRHYDSWPKARKEDP